MPSVEELLSVAEVDANTRSAMDSRIEIDADTRIILMMPQDELFGVESDEKSERKYFKVPKIVGNGVDLSKLQLRINYQNASKIPSGKDMYIVQDATVYNDEWVYFSWELSRKVTQYKGSIYFIVCAIKADSNGNITNEWNTTLAEGKVLEGLEVETSQEQQYQASDYLEQLKQQLLDYSKEIKDTFPSDYTQMQDDIGSLKEDLNELDSKLSESIVEISNEFSRYNIFDKSKAEIVSIMCNSSLVFISGGGVQSTIWKCEPNTTYTISWEGISGNNRYIIYTSKDMPVINGTAKALRSINVSNVVSGSNRHYATITTTSEENYLLLYFWVNASGGEATLDKMQISNGSKLLDYVPYENYAMPNLKLVQQQFDGITIDVTNCTDDMAELLGVKNLGALDKGYICLVADDGYANVSNVTFSIVREKKRTSDFSIMDRF